MYIKNNLKRYRDLYHFKQSDIAEYLNISVRQYQNLESGTSKGNIQQWYLLAKLFNTTIDNLIEQDADYPPRLV